MEKKKEGNLKGVGNSFEVARTGGKEDNAEPINKVLSIISFLVISMCMLPSQA
jgi:hypothetical protein